LAPGAPPPEHPLPHPPHGRRQTNNQEGGIVSELEVDLASIVISIAVGVIVGLGSTIVSTEYSNWRERKITYKKEKENKVNDHKKNLMIDFRKGILGAPIGGGIGSPRSPCLSIESFERSDELIEHLTNYPEFWNIREKALELLEKYNIQSVETQNEIEEHFINIIETEGISIQTYYHNEARIKREFYNPEKLCLILRVLIRQGKELVPFKVIGLNGKYVVGWDVDQYIAESKEKVKAESISRIANQVSKIYFEKVKIIENINIESDKLRKSFDKEMLRLAMDVERGVTLRGKCRVCKDIYHDC